MGFARGSVVVVAAWSIVFLGASASNAGAVWEFRDCVGPSGSPTGFLAEHEASNGAAFRLAGSAEVFVGLIFRDVTAGKEFSPPGISSAGVASITCTTENPFTHHVLRISGVIA